MLNCCNTHAIQEKILAYIHIIADLKFHYIYFKYENDKWEEISHDEYDEKMKRSLEERTFDINNPDTEYTFKVDKNKFYGLPASIYMPLLKYKIKKVEDSSSTVWEAKGNEICTFVALHGYPQDVKMMHMFIKYDESYETLFFQKTPTGWERTSKRLFYSQLEIYDMAEEFEARVGKMSGGYTAV